MKTIAIALLVLIMGGVFCIAHERDILNTCREQGNSGAAMWTEEIKREEIK